MLAKIFDWELTARFIGAEADSTLCESDGRVIRLLSSPLKVDDQLRWRDGARTETSDPDLSEVDQYLEQMEANKELLSNSPDRK